MLPLCDESSGSVQSPMDQVFAFGQTDGAFRCVGVRGPSTG